jgi:hypothetical protein
MRSARLLLMVCVIAAGCGSSHPEAGFSPLTPAAVEHAASAVGICLAHGTDASPGCGASDPTLFLEFRPDDPVRCPVSYLKAERGIAVFVCPRPGDAKAQARSVGRVKRPAVRVFDHVVAVENVVIAGRSARAVAPLARALLRR